MPWRMCRVQKSFLSLYYVGTEMFTWVTWPQPPLPDKPLHWFKVVSPIVLPRCFLVSIAGLSLLALLLL